jgi:hypothetical protein
MWFGIAPLPQMALILPHQGPKITVYFKMLRVQTKRLFSKLILALASIIFPRERAPEQGLTEPNLHWVREIGEA